MPGEGEKTQAQSYADNLFGKDQKRDEKPEVIKENNWNKIDEIDKNLDAIDQKYEKINEDFKKEMLIQKEKLDKLKKEYPTFDQELRTQFDALEKDYNDLAAESKLSGDYRTETADIDNQSYYGPNKIDGLKYDSKEIFKDNEALFNGVHANWEAIRYLETLRQFLNVAKEYIQELGYTLQGGPAGLIKRNFENGIRSWVVSGEHLIDNTGKTLGKEKQLVIKFG